MAQIIIADDEVQYLDVFCEGMEALGHQAIGVTSGTQLIDQLERRNFDIVFLDVIMEGGGAITLTHEVSKIDPGLPIVILTGRLELLDSPVVSKGLRMARASMPKTATLAELGSMVRDIARSSDRGSEDRT